jgi:hypothetical protein
MAIQQPKAALTKRQAARTKKAMNAISDNPQKTNVAIAPPIPPAEDFDTAIYGNRYTYEQVEAALHAANGNFLSAALALRCSYSTIYRWTKKDPRLQEIRAIYEDELVDLAEMGIRERILARDTTAMIFTLKTKGKHRGWAERIEHTGANGEPIKVMSLSAVFEMHAADRPLDEFE